MGELRYRLNVLCWSSKDEKASLDFTVECYGVDKDELLNHFKAFPAVRNIKIVRLEDEGVWVAESPE